MSEATKAFAAWATIPKLEHSNDVERFTDFVVKQWKEKDEHYSTFEAFKTSIQNASNSYTLSPKEIQEAWERKEFIESILFDLDNLGYLEI